MGHTCRVAPPRHPTPPPQGGWGLGDTPPNPPTPPMGYGGWGAQGGGGYPSGPPQATRLGALGHLDAVVHAFAAALQGVVVAGVGTPPPPTHRSGEEGHNTLASAPPLCL